MADTCDPSTRETEVGGAIVPNQPGLDRSLQRLKINQKWDWAREMVQLVKCSLPSLTT